MILVRDFCSLGALIRGLSLSFARNQMPGGRDPVKANAFDLARQSEKLQHPNAPPIKIDLVPPEAMTCRRRMRVMIVMPTFAKSQ